MQTIQTETTHMAVHRTFPVHPMWVAGALIVSWLGLWIHEFHRIPAQFGFTLEGLLFHLLPALIIFLACWRFPGHVFPIYGMWVLGILHGLGGGVLSVLPLPIWPFVPDQTLSHYVVHGVYFLAQVPLLLLAFTLMRHLRVAPLAQSAKTRRAETDSVGAGRKHHRSISPWHRGLGYAGHCQDGTRFV